MLFLQQPNKYPTLGIADQNQDGKDHLHCSRRPGYLETNLRRNRFTPG